MSDFGQQIENFINYGIYNYQFDDVGNEILNPSSSTFQQVYLSIPVGNYTLNNSKISSFYDVDFTEFVPVTSSLSLSSSFSQQAAIDQISNITYQNTQLQSQLQILVSNNEMNSGSANNQLIMNTIIQLRIQLGQGSNYSDFESTFPYLPTQ